MVSRAGGRSRPEGINSFELFSWYFFRISGLLLLFMAITHVVIMHVVNTVDQIDYAFVADRWGSPFWRVYDFTLLVLSMLHGINGARLSIDDYIRSAGWRVAAHTTLWVIALVFLIIGGLAIVTFDPTAVEGVQAGR